MASPLSTLLGGRCTPNRLRWLLAVTLLLLLINGLRAEDQFAAAVNRLGEGSFAARTALIEQLSQQNDPRTLALFEALLDGRLQSRSDGKVVIVNGSAEPLSLTDPVDGAALPSVTAGELKKIALNNALRSLLRGKISNLRINSSDHLLRLEAARGLVKNPAAEQLPAIEAAIAREQHQQILSTFKLARAMIMAREGEEPQRLEAIHALRGALEPEVRSLLTSLLETDADNSPKEPSAAIRGAAEAVLRQLETEASFYQTLENLFFGLSLGSVLLLSAVGLAITFGVMGVINMAHGEMLMLGAYTTYVVQQLMPGMIDQSLWVAIPAAFIVTALFGIAIERGVIRFLYGRPLETLLATFGVSLILQQLVRSIFTPLNRSVLTPSWMSGSWQLNGALSITYNRLFIILFSLMVFVGLILLLKRTRFGLSMRAVTQNRQMAQALGIRSGWVDALTFGLGSGIAGIGGVALSQLTNVGPNLGQAYIIDSFMVVVFGGVGNLLGTLVAALSLGLVNKFVEPLAGAVLAKILVLLFIILFIQRRPTGLFALKGRAAEE
ncbi:MAG: urea ABC transporter permease subunit UrtB [Pseudomonadales bacterium]|nr:urea ABC transporter permease subunit UrtB [Pseudomonadales bacterium]HMW15353.1 urea ABC transporter permease subunit UrtB [Pseudomonadales bacterium]HMW82257.1 urea ABC transporter permease subunit UrtB [Pseudomonadales bacterium]HMZ70872.1 urea ABC transporter permease subunit UrtB [Pseudomonadales bacterium]HMZ91922.1 urea ABC transporter permease subunit UrtB [Pseudomonadales bacterium]